MKEVMGCTIRRLALLVPCLAAAMSFAAEGRWTTNGPFGGCCGRLLFHPTVNGLVFGLGNRELFRSTDYGLHWKRLNMARVLEDPYTVLLGDIRLTPSRPDRIVSATRSAVLVSEDRGDHWQVITSTFTPSPHWLYAMLDFELDPKDPASMYSVFDTSAFYKTIDGGATWNSINNAPDAAFLEFEINPVNGQVMYAHTIGDENHMVMKSFDGGVNWQSVGSGLPQEFWGPLVLDPRHPSTVHIGGTAKTVDGGKTWTQASCDCDVEDIAIDPNNRNTLYIASVDGTLKSTSGGVSWSLLDHPKIAGADSSHAVGVSPHDSNIVLVGTLAGLLRSRDAGASWQLVSNGPGVLSVHGISLSQDRSDLLFASSSTVLYRTTNGGSVWRPLYEDLPEDFWPAEAQFYPGDSNLAAMVGSHDKSIDGTYFHVGMSTDAGRSWVFRPFKFNLRHIVFDPSNPSGLYIGTDGSGMAKSTDSGKTWRSINKGLTPNKDSISVITIDPRHPRVVLIGTNTNKIFRSDDGGETWRKTTDGIPPPTEDAYDINSIRFDPTNSRIVYAANNRDIFNSTDGGQSWSTKNKGLPSDGDIYSLAIDPADGSRLYLGGDLEPPMRVSTDGGESWHLFDTGELPRDVYDLELSAAQPNKIYAATSEGVYSYVVPSR